MIRPLIKSLLGQLLFLVILCSGSVIRAEQVPQLIPYQGRLTDEIGFPVTSLTQVSFSIYSDSITVSPLWSETAHILPDHDGSISWLLGQNNLFDSSLFDGTLRYLGITINSNAEMRPRIPIGSVPYALGSEVSSLAPEAVEGTAATLSADQTMTGANNFTGPTLFIHSDAQNYAVRTENLGGGTALRVLTNSDNGPALEVITGLTAEPIPGAPMGTGPLLRAYRAFFGPLQQLDLNLRFSIENDGTVLADGAFVGGGADFAELFELSDNAETLTTGMVLMIDPSHPGLLRIADEPKSRLVAGVYSPRPGFLGTTDRLSELDKDQNGGTDIPELHEQKMNENRVPVAVVGIVQCNVSDESGPIAVGDLLVSSSTTGYAMRDENPSVGTVLGKALGAHASGLGQITILLTLQ
ncbi:MAG: hypothetical protein P1R58_06855 [bacterium]|nr:hypothetical protein [bacterium]